MMAATAVLTEVLSPVKVLVTVSHGSAAKIADGAVRIANRIPFFNGYLSLIAYRHRERAFGRLVNKTRQPGESSESPTSTYRRSNLS